MHNMDVVYVKTNHKNGLIYILILMKIKNNNRSNLILL